MMTALLFLSLMLQPGVPVLLADDVFMASPLDSTSILFSTGEGGLFTVDVESGDIRRWSLSWYPEDDGWSVDGSVFELSVSPNGRWVCLAVAVYLPEEYEVPESAFGMRSALVGILAKWNGSSARPVFIGILVGGGPTYEFSSRSKYLVGSPMFACEPTPPGYSLYAMSGWDNPPVEPFNAIAVETGERIMMDVPDIGDGFWKCPYSDFFRIENNWYEVHDFGSFNNPRILGHYETGEGPGNDFQGWVLPDAVLITEAGSQKLLFVDGSTCELDLPFTLRLCTWLPDGSYLYTTADMPERLIHGEIDWKASQTTELAGFDFPGDAEEYRFTPMPGSKGVFFVDPRDTERLFYMELR